MPFDIDYCLGKLYNADHALTQPGALAERVIAAARKSDLDVVVSCVDFEPEASAIRSALSSVKGGDFSQVTDEQFRTVERGVQALVRRYPPDTRLPALPPEL